MFTLAESSTVSYLTSLGECIVTIKYGLVIGIIFTTFVSKPYQVYLALMFHCLLYHDIMKIKSTILQPTIILWVTEASPYSYLQCQADALVPQICSSHNYSSTQRKVYTRLKYALPLVGNGVEKVWNTYPTQKIFSVKTHPLFYVVSSNRVSFVTTWCWYKAKLVNIT